MVESDNSGDISAINKAIVLLGETETNFYNANFKKDINEMLSSLETWYSLLLGFETINLEALMLEGDKFNVLKEEILSKAKVNFGSRGTIFYDFKNCKDHISRLILVCNSFKILEREGGLYSIKSKQKERGFKDG